jgi:endonuclease/exonuclease/phosphatase family metal-dependent hydrolase
MAPLVLSNYNLTLEHLFRKSPSGFAPEYDLIVSPYAFNLFTGEREESVRIDYIFVKNVSQVLGSQVFLNLEPFWASDHSALLTKIVLP